MKHICFRFVMSAPCVLVALLFAVATSSKAGERHFRVQGPANPKAYSRAKEKIHEMKRIQEKDG